MSPLTTHQIKLYFEKYSEIDVTFSKKVIDFTRIIPNEIYLKCGNDTYPCILYSSSMIGAKIVIQMNKLLSEKINKHNKKVSLRFAFKREDNPTPITFFILSKIEGYTPFKSDKPNLFFVTMRYNQNPPNDLISILGSLIDAGSNVKKRKHERIIISPENLRLLKIKQAQASLVLGKLELRCLLRDLSLSGAKIVAVGKEEDFLNKKIIVGIRLNETKEPCKVIGTVIRCEQLKERDELITLGILFEEGNVPANYTKRIINFFRQRKSLNTKNESA